jgi:hypothetical protein
MVMVMVKQAYAWKYHKSLNVNKKAISNPHARYTAFRNK